MASFAVVERADVWYCSQCEKFYDDDEVEEAGPLYRCGGCDNTFNLATGETGTHQCACGKFAAKEFDQSCPEGCEEELDSVEALKDTEHGGTLFVSLDKIRENYG